MALTADRSGDIVGAIWHEKQDEAVAASAVIFTGGVYSYDAAGYLAVCADSVAQAGKKIVVALAAANNTGGANGAKTVRVMKEGELLIPTGALVKADTGKAIHATSDNVFALTSTNNRRIGYLAEWGASLCKVLLTTAA